MCRFILKIVITILFIQLTYQAKKQKTAVISDIEDIKEFKKILKAKTNVLVLFVNNTKDVKQVFNVFKNAADAMKGQATLVMFDCNNSYGKKICKKLKATPEKQSVLKHYKDGHYNRDYDREMTVNAMCNFLRDPTGELPWEEDPQASAIQHLTTGEALRKFLKSGAGAYKKSLVMFYAPWCTYCKIMKPDYVQAAKELKGEAVLAAIDVAKPGNSMVREEYNVTGFPTLLYFEKGQAKFPYSGENKKQAIVAFMRDPSSQIQKKKEVVKDESWSIDSDVVHLTSDNFDSILSKADKALVVFYAPWCGHCKRIKPEVEKAATRIIYEKINGLIAAVDATGQRDLASRFNVKGYPTLKYFSKGRFLFDAGHVREEEDIVSFMKDPQEPPPPPPPEAPWSEEESNVRHLNLTSFKSTLRKVKHAIVMFYAPWCGHCKMTKPDFVKAAEVFADELMVAFGAVDCTIEQELCSNYDVTGYPTIKYFSYYDRQVKEYTGGRKEEDFVAFINSQLGTPAYSTKTPSNQDAGFGANVRILTDSDFSQVIEGQSVTLVMFYATWCGHCTSSKPAYSKVATTLKEANVANVVAIDAAENPKTADFAKIETLPTYKIYRAGKELATYDGDRSEKSLVDFVNKHKVKDEL